MAKTKTEDNERVEPGPQAPAAVWSPEALMRSLVSGTLDEKVAVLRRSGILDENDQISKSYKSWGRDRLTRAGNYEPKD